MQSKLIAGLKKEEQEEIKKIFSGSKKVLDILHKICYDQTIKFAKVSEADYDNPSWSHKQAHVNGKLEAYREMLLILKSE